MYVYTYVRLYVCMYVRMYAGMGLLQRMQRTRTQRQRVMMGKAKRQQVQLLQSYFAIEFTL